MKRPYPSMSTKGWIEDVPGVIDAVIANFFLTHPSLSVEFNASIKSLPYLIQQFGNDEGQIQTEIGDALTVLLGRYFDKPVVEVRITYPNTDDLIRMNVGVYLAVERDGESYNVARELSTVNGKVVGIMEINNG